MTRHDGPDGKSGGSLSRRRLVAAGASLAASAATAQAASKDATADLARAAEQGGVLRLEAGRYITQGLNLSKNLLIEGVPGQTILVGGGIDPILQATDIEELTLFGLIFDGKALPDALLKLSNIGRLLVDSCVFTGSEKTGLELAGCAGHVTRSLFAKCGEAGLMTFDSKGLEISANTVEDMGNNGIQIWTSEPRDDGSRVINNLVRRIAARAGGSGENGNGISVFRAGNVMIAQNRISDCDYSGIRNNSGSNVQIIGNNISRAGEVALYSEFSFEGAVISQNLIEDCVFGISITNFDKGGRLALCTDNIVRNIKGGMKPSGRRPAGGIHAEADTLISGNLVENAAEFGISLGYGTQSRNLIAQNNLVRACGRGIIASIVEGAGPSYATNNLIVECKTAAITGYEYEEARTGDLAKPGVTLPSNLHLSGNIVRD